MSFFDSEVVRAEMTEISELQDDVYRNVFNFPKMSSEEKLFHVSLLERLIEKNELKSVVLSEYRQSLISSTVTGKVRVTEDMI